MSLNQKYTWQDFLKDNPELKEKGIKRTSSEGEKAFKSAFKSKVKDYLNSRDEFIKKMIVKAEQKRNTIVEKTKTFQKAKKWPKAKIYQAKAGDQDAAIFDWKAQKTKNDQKKKSL